MKTLLLITFSLLMTSCITPRTVNTVNPYVYQTPVYGTPTPKAQSYHVDKPGYGSYTSGYDITPQ